MTLAKAGVYCIRNVVNGKIYIGSSVNVKRRLQAHRYTLRVNKHKNAHLQSAWIFYGKDCFDFVALEYVGEQKLLATEQKWMNLLDSCNPANGYNIALIAGRTTGHVWSEESKQKISIANTGRKRSQEHKDAISKAHFGKKKSASHVEKIANSHRGLKRSPEFCAAVSARNKGKKITGKALENLRLAAAKRRGVKKTPEAIAKTAAGISKQFVVTHPSGLAEEVSNLAAFCRKYDLSDSILYAVANGKFSQHKGFKCIRISEKREFKPSSKETKEKVRASKLKHRYRLVSQWGQVVETDNLNQFCETRGISSSNMYAVANGKKLTCKGWQCRRL